MPAYIFTQAELDDADKLADYAVETRYPPNTRITLTEMHEALRIAQHFRDRLKPLIQAAIS